jgi:hypothetical protein
MAAGSKVWTVFSLGAALAAATLARKGLTTSWKLATGKNPPDNPADPNVDLREAVLWALLSGMVFALVKMLATRRAARYYMRSTGNVPPELESEAAEAGVAPA